MSHLKRLSAPKSWSIQRKGITFITRPSPGPHKLKESIPLNILSRDVLHQTKTTKETKIILNKGLILVDNIVRKDHRFPVGIMDTISIPTLDKYYQVLYDKNKKFVLKPIKKEQAQEKTHKIINKKILKKNKIQINLYDGKNILVPKSSSSLKTNQQQQDADPYKVGDSVIIKDNKIIKLLKFEKGAKIYLIKGKYVGSTGILEKIKKFNGISSDIISVKIDKEIIETKKDYAFVIQ